MPLITSSAISKNSVAVANFREALHVTIRRRDRAERGADDRLENKRRDVFRTVALQQTFEFIRAIHIAFRILQPERAAVAKTRRDVAPFLQQRSEWLAAANVAGNGERAQRAAVVALLARNHAEAFGFAALDPILARELDGGFRGFRAAGSEIDAAILAHRRRSQGQNARGQFFGDGGVKLRRMNVGEPGGLFGHGLRPPARRRGRW